MAQFGTKSCLKSGVNICVVSHTLLRDWREKLAGSYCCCCCCCCSCCPCCSAVRSWCCDRAEILQKMLTQHRTRERVREPSQHLLCREAPLRTLHVHVKGHAGVKWRDSGCLITNCADGIRWKAQIAYK